MTDTEMDARLKVLFNATTPKMYKSRHASTCKCYDCMVARVDNYKARAKLAVQGGGYPQYLDQTIPVRSHWRAGKNHLKNDPTLRAMVREIVREILKKEKH